MNLQKLFEAQKVLDERIIKEHRLEGQDLLQNKILALLVELGECANEYRAWKFWSKDQNPRNFCMNCMITSVPHTCKNPLLEEYIDCLHFIFSIGNDLCITPKISYNGKRNATNLFLAVYEAVIYLDISTNIVTLHRNEREFNRLWRRFVGLGKALGFTSEQIEEAYWNKNKVNHARQDNGY